jgi:hypothetical protein
MSWILAAPEITEENHLNNTISMFGRERRRSGASSNDLEVGSASLLLDPEVQREKL